MGQNFKNNLGKEFQLKGWIILPLLLNKFFFEMISDLAVLQLTIEVTPISINVLKTQKRI